MKLITKTFPGLGLLVCLLSCGSDTPDHSAVSKKLLDLETEGIKREFRNDTAFLSSLMDSTFIELSGDTIKEKHGVLKTIFQNNLNRVTDKITLDSFRLEEPIVHVYDKSAVVTFIMHTFGKKDTIPYDRRTRFYDLWVLRCNEWKAATWQATPLSL